MNQIMLHGRIGKDPEISYNQDGKPVTKFTMATDNGKDKDPTWHNITAFNKQAETIAEYFKKGSEIIVIGKQDHWKYEEKWFSGVVLFSFDFCGNKETPKENKDDDCPF